MRSKPEIEKAVDKGITWFDQNKPGWREKKLSLLKLKTSSSIYCPAAQVFGGDYAEARILVRSQGLEPGDLCFTIGQRTCCAESGDEFNLLDEVWLEKLVQLHS